MTHTIEQSGSTKYGAPTLVANPALHAPYQRGSFIQYVLLFLCAMLLAPGVSAGELFKCKGGDGKISFSDVPCPNRAGVKALSVPAAARAPQAAAHQPYQSGKSPFTDLMLKNLTEQCAKGVKPACRYAEKTRAGGYGFGDMSTDIAEENCAGGEKQECVRLCTLDPKRAWCQQSRGNAPPGQTWWQGARTSEKYEDTIEVFCVWPKDLQDRPLVGPRRISTYKNKFRNPNNGLLLATLDAAASATCAADIEEARSMNRMR